jgi:hypothetical protein
LVLRDRQRIVVSAGTALCLLLAVAAPLVLRSPREPPAYALYSGIVFYLEQFFAVFVMSYAILAVTARTLIHGELPSAITKEGLTWSDEASGAVKQAIARLQAQLDILEQDVEEIAEHVALEDRLPRVVN